MFHSKQDLHWPEACTTPAGNSGARAVIARSRGALLLSRTQASVAEFRRETLARDELGAPATRSRGRSLRQGDAEAGMEPEALGRRPRQLSGQPGLGRLLRHTAAEAPVMSGNVLPGRNHEPTSCPVG